MANKLNNIKTDVIKNQARVRKGDLPSPMLWHGDVEKFLDALPETEVFDLVITSPPYNIGKPYEQRIKLEEYLDWQERIFEKTLLRLKRTGSICWQVGNYVQKGTLGKESEVLPLDILFFNRFHNNRHELKLRNRVIWHFGHGLHCKYRFSGRYEMVLWFTKSDDYYFDLDAVRTKPKYPGKKYFKGPKAGQYSCNPKGKNPEDVWSIEEQDLTIWDQNIWEIPNVKSNHIEKTFHPCQFPIALVDRFVLSLTPKNGLVFDPFAGVASAGIAAVIHNRRFWGCEIENEYIAKAQERLDEALKGDVEYRPFEKPIYDHNQSKLSREPSGHAIG